MAGECQALAVRAAADAAEAEPGRRDVLRGQVSKLLGRDDPTDIPSQAQNAYRRARTAELSRLANEPRPDLWAAAATEWDRINRPFDASYSRWRGAQAATATGRTDLAQRLLRSAAAHSRDHVPLTAAIERTATDVAASSRAPARQRNRT